MPSLNKKHTKRFHRRERRSGTITERSQRGMMKIERLLFRGIIGNMPNSRPIKMKKVTDAVKRAFGV